jgi:undecaprenyl-diphosphatase
MTVVQSIILGCLQGFTEFLPVSSSGHLALAQQLFGFKTAPVAFDVFVHLATLIVLIIYFFSRLLHLNRRLILLLIIGTIPAVVVGIGLDSIIESLFNSALFLGVGFIITGLLLLLTKRYSAGGVSLKESSLKQVILVGIAQAIAIIPSISRSGATIATGQFVGLSREASFLLSFYLAIPAISGAVVLKLPDILSASSQNLLPLLTGFITAAITGYLSLTFLEKVMKSSKFYLFGYYCLALGLVTFIIV